MPLIFWTGNMGLTKSFFFVPRAQQQEQREMKLRLQQEVDPGNPSWEFLQMIRCVAI